MKLVTAVIISVASANAYATCDNSQRSYCMQAYQSKVQSCNRSKSDQQSCLNEAYAQWRLCLRGCGD